MPLLNYTLSLVLFVSPAPAANPSSPDQVRFSWESRDRSVIESQQQYLRAQGAQVTEIQEKEPRLKSPTAIALFVLVGVAAVSELAHAIVDAVKDYKQGGAVVDMQGSKIKIIENPALERGHILVRTRDGQVKEIKPTSRTKTDLAAMVSSLSKLLRISTAK